MNPFTQSRAYVIGIANYHYIPWRLHTPANDADAIAKVLQGQGYEVTTRIDPDATGLRALFRQIATEVTLPGSRVLVYYAGHGVQRESAMGLKGYFVPVDARPESDANMIPMEELSELLDALPVRHLLLVLDCCFAGSFRMPDKRSFSFLPKHEHKNRQHYDIYTSQPARKVMTSTSYKQKAYDRFEDDDPNSPFARFLLQALAGEADISGDRLITAGELNWYLTDKLARITEYAGNLQSVGLDTLDGDGEGEYLFFLDGFDLEKLPEQAYQNPYKGLESYEPSDASLFFGRQKATRALLDKVKAQPFVIVVGPSGCGKSSLVKAGVVPRLSNLSDREIPVILPGRNPKAAIPPADTWDVLVIDQWEEVISQAQDEAGVDAFYAEIGQLLGAGKRIIGTLRADFEAQARHESLESAWRQGRFLVPPFTAEEYRDVIVQPAKRVACLFESKELIGVIETEVAQQPGALPLLSFMLSELFERSKERAGGYQQIQWKHYEAVGGVSGALLNKAEAVYASLPDEAHRDTMRRIMLRMVTLTAGDMASRRVLLSEFEFDTEVESRQAETVLQNLEAGKLIRRLADDAGRQAIEPTHDALVRSWERLWNWVRDIDKSYLRLLDRLGAAVNEYTARLRYSKYLWFNDPRLDQVLILIGREPLLLNKAEKAFVKASVKERRRERWRNRRDLAAAGCLPVLVTALIILVGILALIGILIFALRG